MTTRIEVLGTGCAKCKATLKMIDELIKSEELDVDLVKVEDIAEIMARGILSTPGVVVNGEMKAVGRVPTRDEVHNWVNMA